MTLYRFIGLVILLMIPCFALWYGLGALPAAPAIWLTQLVLPWAAPDIFHSITLDQNQLMVFSGFGERDDSVVPLSMAEYQLAFPQSVRSLSYSIPFYTALHFASRIEDSVGRYARGLMVLWFLMFVGFISVALKNVMVSVGPVLLEPYGLPPLSAIALVYQFSTLIAPTVGPLLLWAWAAHDSPHWQALLLGRVPEQPADTSGEQ